MSGRKKTTDSLDPAGRPPGLLNPPAFPSLNSQQRADSQPSARIKVELEPGHSLMDWIRLGNSSKDLTSVGGRLLRVTPDELAKHNKRDDAWMALRGAVYNVTPYLKYHPGGVEELMRGAGADGTLLFDQIHKWVNAESMLAKCLVGKLVDQPPKAGARKVKPPPSFSSADKDGFLSPPLMTKTTIDQRTDKVKDRPRNDWMQSAETVNIVVYTKHRALAQEDVIVDTFGPTQLKASITIDDYVYSLHLDLHDDIKPSLRVQVRGEGTVEITLQKSLVGAQWGTLGSTLPGHDSFLPVTETIPDYREYTVGRVSEVTHNTLLIRLDPPPASHLRCAIGKHVRIKLPLHGIDVVRSYTPVLPALLSSEEEQHNPSLYLMIKIYPDGAMTPLLAKLINGDRVPVGDPDGSFSVASIKDAQVLLLFAAGTGFTPMVKLIDFAFKHKRTCKTHLFLFNKSEKDIPWRRQLDEFACNHFEQFAVDHVLSEADSSWFGLTGRINEEMFKRLVPTDVQHKPKDMSYYMCACGPDAFTNEVNRLRKRSGIPDSKIHCFLG